MKHSCTVKVGPVVFRIGSDWAAPIRQIESLYAGYPAARAEDAVASVRLESRSALRRFVRPQVHIAGDHWLPEAVPLPLSQALLAAEMGMNLQVALGWRQHLLLHASAVERDGRALLMIGESGSGKSTLAALLGEGGWRFLGDEFVLLDCVSCAALAFPRLVSLKNEAIAEMEARVPAARFGPRIIGTPKGDIRHMVPPADAIARMDEPARPAALIFPSFGAAAGVRGVPPSEALLRLTSASTNYVALGEPAFDALTGLVRAAPALAIGYTSTEEALAGVDVIAGELGL